MTESIGNLIAALAKAQAKFDPPKKNKVAKVKSEKGSYEYRYSDLADLIAAVRAPLSENELAFTHRLIPAERGTVVSTILAHSSGEMLTSDYLVPNFQRQQEFGSALTYAKRYALSGLLGVAADDDDDGNIADASPVQQPRGYGNGATRTVAAPPPPEMPAHLTTNGKVLPPHPEESGEATAARQRIPMLVSKIKQLIETAPDAHRLDVTWDGDELKAELAEIEQAPHAGTSKATGKSVPGFEAANQLRALYTQRIADLRSA